jgi:hypothetical protein
VIKLNNDKIEVITTVSKPETYLSTKLAALSDKFKRAFNIQHSQVASMITCLEKFEGEVEVLIFLMILSLKDIHKGCYNQTCR